MYGIKRVGPEFYGTGCLRPFPSLETLYLEDMEEWEEWIYHENGQEVDGFPHLQKLLIVHCPKLQGRLPEHLPSLKRLVIQGCRELLVSIGSLPVDCRFEIDGCKLVHPRTYMDFASLNPIIFSDVLQGNVILIQRFMKRLSDDEGVEIVGYKASTSFWRSGIASVQEAKDFCYSMPYPNYQIMPLLYEKEEELQLQGLPCICQYLVLSNTCLTKLPQVLLNLGFLVQICIAYCSDVVYFPEASLPSRLRVIDIEDCDALKCLPDSLMDSTSLECLSISSCKSVMYLARNQLSLNLKELKIDDCDNLRTLVQEENNTVNHLSLSGYLPKALKYLSLGFCSNLESIAERFHNNSCLEAIDINNCEKLHLLPEDLQKLNQLRSISISRCPSLVSFPGGGLPLPNLTMLVVHDCEKLEALPHNMHQLNHLQYLTISSCLSLVSFPAEGLPSKNLTSLQIKSCNRLEDLPNNMHQLNHLRQIEIWNCSRLVAFPAGGFPSTNMKELKIGLCKKLETLPNGMHKLNNIKKIEIMNCSSLVSLPEGGLPSTNLTVLTIDDCWKLKGLPNCMHNLTSLQELRILNCQGMESFPEDGFPVNLESLSISDTPKICEPLFKWGLHRLSSLRKLCIYGCPDMVSFPPKETGIMLPTSLTILEIGKFLDLECLSSVIQSLNSLEELRLQNCPKLKYFPKKGLPLSLLGLWIRGCPLLQRNCEKYGGRYYWPMIAHIPDIHIY